ncbi:hypothetical protein BIV57_18725 [Mangrovactinospora gilvigrisea]|uniref:Uncharacterized protein n=2 Tax=Mangrovactinospora gilvigrisea TaxID=1428644 RepID=A0A1J7BBC5_9ACTN|nr:hypothetical protein BIV57_18725 [Mangrovactinospora gilvigrisea]
MIAQPLTDHPRLEAILVEAGFTPEQQCPSLFTAGGLDMEDANRLARKLAAAGFVPDRLDSPPFNPGEAEIARQGSFNELAAELHQLAAGPDAPLLETLTELTAVATWAGQQTDHGMRAHADPLMAIAQAVSTSWEEAFSAAACLTTSHRTSAVVVAVAMRDPGLGSAGAAARLQALCLGPGAPMSSLHGRLNRMAVIARAGLGADGKGLAASFTHSADKVIAAAHTTRQTSEWIAHHTEDAATRSRSRVPQDPGVGLTDPSAPPRIDDGGPPHGRHR